MPNRNPQLTADLPANATEFQSLLRTLTGIAEELSPASFKAVSQIFDHLGTPQTLDTGAAAGRFYGRLNIKLFLNSDILDAIYGKAAAQGLTFNYHAKKAIAWSIHSGNTSLYRAAIEKYCPDESLAESLISLFGGSSHQATRDQLSIEMTKPTKLRKAHDRVVAQDVQDSAAACLVWALWDNDDLRRYFASDDEHRVVDPEFMAGLRRLKPEIFLRHRSLVVRQVRPPTAAASPDRYHTLRTQLAGWLAAEFEALDNHGYLAINIVVSGPNNASAWELAADLTLFAERHKEERLEKLYFRSESIRDETAEHVRDIDLEAARFDLAFDGFTYRDLFVLHDNDGQIVRLVLLFQKNERDETLIPCPTCRGTDIAGNSYPTLGVRSWECRNVLCPDRSIYNRGKRYSLKGLVTQEAIETPGNEIPIESIRRWRRDVLNFAGDDDITEMMVRHYSMVGDAVVLLGGLKPPLDHLGRIFSESSLRAKQGSDQFWDSHFFHRYAIGKPGAEYQSHHASDFKVVGSEESWMVVRGDCREVIANYPNDHFDGAVTSPPYFNAREYSQWSNLYCYLYDMRLIHRELLRVLKPGAIYGFNVFDYFDNERTITFSAMANKRIALSALFVDLFRRIGFTLVGNLVWDKGDIEGKRAYNAGNLTPFYQSPLNCWEHILLFEKPGGDRIGEIVDPRRIRRIRPVFKMVRGQNLLGHSAPFPIEVPQAVLEGLPRDSLVLDEFGGSGTTARAAMSLGQRSVLAEQNPEYFELAVTLTSRFAEDLESRTIQASLF